jgi:hypothetical protein
MKGRDFFVVCFRRCFFFWQKRKRIKKCHKRSPAPKKGGAAPTPEGSHGWGEIYEFLSKVRLRVCVLLHRRDDPIGCAHFAATATWR